VPIEERGGQGQEFHSWPIQITFRNKNQGSRDQAGQHNMTMDNVSQSPSARLSDIVDRWSDLDSGADFCSANCL
jgi:hypothetical protein